MRSFLRAAAVAGALLALAAPFAVAREIGAEPTFSPERFRAHVEFLADDLLEGRAAGERGHEIAALYVAQQFHALGLKPAGENGGWRQSVPLREASFADAGARLTLTGPGGSRTFPNAEEVIIAPTVAATTVDFEAPLVFAGFGFDDKARGYDDYRGLDVRGKIVVVLSGSPKGAPSEIGAHLNREKAVNASKRGAIGVITIDTDLSARTFPWEKRVGDANDPRMAWLRPDGTPEYRAANVRGTASLNGPAAELLFAGTRRTLADIRAEADRPGGRPKGFALKTRARFETTTAHRRLESPNVIALLPGADPALKDEVVVVMGHLDHLGTRPGAPDPVYNGAMDNAAGIASILETARAFVESGQRPRRSVLFLAVTAEEKGLLGADYFAENPVVPLANIVGVVNLDMPILTYDFADIVAFGADSSTMGVAVRRAAAAMGVKVTPDPAPEQGTFTRSDHYQLVRRGVPSIFLKTGPTDASGGNGGDVATRAFRSTHYHEPSDDLSRDIDWRAGARFARVNWLIARELANAGERPRWYAGDFFGDTFAKGAPRAAKPDAGPPPAR